MTPSVRQTSWHGLAAWTLENETLRTVVVPELGAKLVSLFDRRSQREWLAGPGARAVRRVPYGAPFHEQDLSGWDEMFPTIVACAYPGPGARRGTPLPDHGEVWALPWTLEAATAARLTLSVEGRALPYSLTRTVEFVAADTLQLQYRLVNLGQDAMPYIWAAHPQFACGTAAEIIFPPQVTAVVNTIPESWGWGAPETRFAWPVAVAPDGSPARIDRIGPPTLHKGRKFFVPPEVQVGWAGLVCHPAGDWLRLEWDPALVPYLGLWIDEGILSHESVAAPEPTTGFYDSLAVAWDKRLVTGIAPGETQSWALLVRLGIGGQAFPDFS
jgi:hypothetical protein